MKKITVVGVGALGSHFVQFMRSEDVEFKIIDFDKVEQKNTLSQFHGKTGVGKHKVQALKQTADLLWKMKLEVNTNKLTDKNVPELLTGAHLVVDCLDNAEARTHIQKWVRAFPVADRMPCLHGAVDGEGSFGRVVWDENFIIDSGSAPGTPTCEDGENLPFIASVASYLARSAQAFLRKGVRDGFQISPGGVVLTR
jgi:molybdopterin/thiamine biosynthesis adenylyltransferase